MRCKLSASGGGQLRSAKFSVKFLFHSLGHPLAGFASEAPKRNRNGEFIQGWT